MGAVASAATPVAEFDARQFRNALGQFATGVTVVTAPNGEGGYVGVTASSFNSVSVDPPLILWSIDNGSRSREAFERAENFVVNVLAADQVCTSNNFARQQEDKFETADYHLSDRGVPVLSGCSAWFHCQTKYLYEGGDHTIIVGEVTNFESSDRDGLLFHQGRYSVSEAHPVVGSGARTESEQGEQGFAADYLHYLVGRCFNQLIDKLEKMLAAENLAQHEYRVLASFGGLEQPDLATLSYYSLLPSETVQTCLEGLRGRGLVAFAEHDRRWGLTEAGQQRVVKLMARAKADEADMLGAFSYDQAQEFKAMLKASIDWTR